MESASINSLGLFLNILGVGIAFFYGYPQPTHVGGAALGLEDGNVLSNGMTVAEWTEYVERRRRRYLWLSRLGLVLMFLGFALQLLATWTPK